MWLDKKYRFVIPGNPVGHTATTNRSKNVSARYRKYAKYAKQVRLYAEMAGVPLPLKSSKDHQIVVNVYPYFKNGTHCDPENVRKGIADALAYDTFKKRKGDDKHFGGKFPPPRYDKENPRVVVVIKPYKKKKRRKK